MTDLSLTASSAAAALAPRQLPIVYLDEYYAAVHKPEGLLVHRSRLSPDQDVLVRRLSEQLGRKAYPIHRLDRATSGVIIFGLTSEATERLAAQFRERRVHKVYRAVVRGWLDGPGFIDHPLEDRDTRSGKRSAVTRFRPLARVELPYFVDRYPTSRYSLVEIRPETGRRHQIRRHFKHIHHPLIGDSHYGKGSHNRFFRSHFGISRLLLCAWSLGFRHPYKRQWSCIRANPDASWNRLMVALGWAEA